MFDQSMNNILLHCQSFNSSTTPHYKLPKLQHLTVFVTIMNRAAKTQQKQKAKQTTKVAKRSLTTKKVTKKATKKVSPVKQSKRDFRVAVVGAAGGIGQPLSLLLKTNYTGLVTSLSLYDVAPVTPGVAADLSHIPTSVQVDAFVGEDKILDALKGADIVVVPAGVPRKPGMTRDDLFNVNANINKNVATAFAKSCPHAIACIISNPVNSMVPLWAEVLTQHGVYNPAKIMGVTSLDIFRANTFASNVKGQAVYVPVIGGHAGTTIVPLFSLASQKLDLDTEICDKLTHRTMFGGDEVCFLLFGLYLF
jgi:malate dehydrogenase